jgi:hypothetical protein
MYDRGVTQELLPSKHNGDLVFAPAANLLPKPVFKAVPGRGMRAEPKNRHFGSKIGPKPAAPLIAIERWGAGMSYKIVATKEDQTMRSVRQSLLIAAAKARVWASEGWDVIVTDGEERTLDPADFEKLFEVKRVTSVTEPQPASKPEMA